MTQLKSQAHPEWPYSGTAHEWRGFVKDVRKMTPVEYRALLNADAAAQDQIAKAIYQKQNFGPELK